MSACEGEYVDLDDVRLFYRSAGSGDDLVVLLHGWPQTSLCWRRIIPDLAADYTVVAPDLRGYGDSGLARSSGYDKRATAIDLAGLLAHLGRERATLVVGHDRGARVAHRWALDRPGQVSRLALLDILPMREVTDRLDVTSASSLWHWFFHLQTDLPELLLRDHVEPYLRHFLGPLVTSGTLDADTFARYVAAFRDPGHLHASLEDYRAGFGVDLRRDEADHAAGNLVSPPVLVLWGADGGLGGVDVSAIWRSYARDVRGTALADCGHYLPEEQPQAVTNELRRFLDAGCDR